MDRIVFWGIGKNGNKAFEELKYGEAEIIFAVDNDPSKQGTIWRDGIKVYPISALKENEYDYVVFTMKNYQDPLQIYYGMGLDEEKTICYCDPQDEKVNRYFCVELHTYREALQLEMLKLQMKYDNAPYELGVMRTPKMKSMLELLDKLIKNKASLCRFGDGELELMREQSRPWFQDVNKKLAERLQEVFYSQQENILIALSDNFGNLDCYTDDAAFAIRNYLRMSGRENITSVIDFDRTYYNAYISRPYLMYKDKSIAKRVFDQFKLLWTDREVLLVEGRYMRTGINNDLFLTAKKVERIICPEKNAFEYYDEILAAVLEHCTPQTLALFCLGPTATVLAYDVGLTGIQAIDLGQIDNEYEWYKMGASVREAIPGKAVPELPGEYVADDCTDADYDRQIVDEVGIEKS